MWLHGKPFHQCLGKCLWMGICRGCMCFDLSACWAHEVPETIRGDRWVENGAGLRRQRKIRTKCSRGGEREAWHSLLVSHLWHFQACVRGAKTTKLRLLCFQHCFSEKDQLVLLFCVSYRGRGGGSQSMLLSRRLHIRGVNFHVYEGDYSGSWGLSREISFCKFWVKFCVSECVPAILFNPNIKLLGFHMSWAHFKLEQEISAVPFYQRVNGAVSCPAHPGTVEWAKSHHSGWHQQNGHFLGKGGSISHSSSQECRNGGVRRIWLLDIVVRL